MRYNCLCKIIKRLNNIEKQLLSGEIDSNVYLQIVDLKKELQQNTGADTVLNQKVNKLESELQANSEADSKLANKVNSLEIENIEGTTASTDDIDSLFS